MNLIKQQNQLQKDAYKVLEKLQLMELLKNFGEPKIVGSLSLGLMTWRDIDIEVIMKKLDMEFIAEICAKLVRKSSRRIDFGVIDNRDGFNNIRPTGIYLGVKYYSKDLKAGELLGANDKVWKIDIHFVLKKDSKGVQKTQEVADRLTDEIRKIILKIKGVVFKSPKFRKEIFSMDIYNAVLNKGVKNINEFKDYLRERGINL
ncbi:hypothetical protein HYW44_05435 [Candidatus Daviesbacteria bacterium]|nr:hypothetical protein [Candidatus Daviesbacteria bacterium]